MSYGDGDGDRDGERDAAVCCVCVCVCVSGGQVVCGRIRRVAYFGWDFPSSE